MTDKNIDDVRNALDGILTMASHKLKLSAYELLGLLEVLKQDVHASVKREDAEE